MNAPTFTPWRCPSLSVTGLLALVAASLCATSCKTQQPSAEVAAQRAAQATANQGVGCLGRIEPGEGIVRVAARSLGGQPSIVGKLFVKEGGPVRAGQVIVELDSERQLESASRQAEARVEVARSHLAQVQAGAKPSELAAQQAEVERVQVELEGAKKEYERYRSLGENVTTSQVDALRLRVESMTRALATARQRLTSLSEVRPVDVNLARAELQEALSNAARARAEHEASVLRSPIDGRVIKIYSWPGELVRDQGVMELAPTEPMYVVAEVPESDLRRVKVGQRAKISGDGLPAPLQGTVERIALKVMQNQVMPGNPASFSDARVVNVWIRVDDSKAVAELIHLRVDVVIQP
jgi:HlyD family secretion protein